MLVQDSLQDIFLKLARNPGLLENARDIRAFLLRIAHNVLRDLARRSSTRSFYEQRDLDGAPTILLPVFPNEDDAFRVAVEASLKSLPEEQRAVVHLKLWEGLTFGQVGETLGISANTAASPNISRVAADRVSCLNFGSVSSLYGDKRTF
jgi:RNA polymerase sigma-70 factor (ECF subfamily)